MTTLTDRYVWAVTRLLPETQRAEIDLELRSSIGDTIEALADGRDGKDRNEVEVEVLRDLGDPRLLAARYAERPRYLIGPDVFPEYVRMLKLIAAVAIPAMAFLAALDAGLDADAGIGDIVGGVVPAVVMAIVHVAFWVTAFYVIRDLVQRDEPFSLDSLPELPTNQRVTLAETVLDLGVVVVSIAALLWDRSARLTDDAGNGVSFLQPSLWDGWMYVVIGLLLAGGVVVVLAHRAGRWTAGLAAADVGVNAALLAVVGWLAFDDRLVNPGFMEVLTERAGWDTVPEVSPWVVVLLVGGVLVWDSVSSVVRVRRGDSATDERSARTPAGTAAGAAR